MSENERVRRVQELRRSSATGRYSPNRDRSERGSRSDRVRNAVRESKGD